MAKKLRKGIRVRYRADGTPVYYIDTTINNVRISERVGTDAEQANKYLSKLESEIFEKKLFPGRAGFGRTVTELLIEYYEKKLRHISSVSTRKYLIDRLDKEIGGKVATDLRVSDIEAYQRKRLTMTREVRYKNDKKEWVTREGELITANTVNHETNELMMCLDWAVRENLIPHNPIKALRKLPEPDPQKVMLDDGKDEGPEWRKLYNAASPELKPRIFLQYKTGMRMSEVCSLKWKYVDLVAKTISLPYRNDNKGKDRDIPLYPDVVQFLAGLPKNTEWVFPDRHGQPIKSYQKQFERARESAGLREEITTHALRRTRLQIWDSIDERASMAAAGHSTDKVHRKHYTEVKPDKLQKLVS